MRSTHTRAAPCCGYPGFGKFYVYLPSSRGLYLPSCPDCRCLVAMHVQLLLVRPLARARHVEGAQRLAGPAVRRAQGQAIALVHYAQYLVGRASGRPGVGG